MQLFGGRFNLIMNDGQKIRSNFDTFVQALLTVFQVDLYTVFYCLVMCGISFLTVAFVFARVFIYLLSWSRFSGRITQAASQN